MKCVVISGSRNPSGQTATATRAVVQGITAKNVQVEEFYLPTLAIERCRQCDDDGWGQCKREGSCIIEDDFARVTEAIRRADIAVFATPVYFSDLSESIRAYLDRLRRITRHETGRTNLQDKLAVGVCVAGGGGGGGPACCAGLEKVLRTTGFEMFDLVPVRRQNLHEKRAVLIETGSAFVNAARA